MSPAYPAGRGGCRSFVSAAIYFLRPPCEKPKILSAATNQGEAMRPIRTIMSPWFWLAAIRPIRPIRPIGEFPCGG